MSQLSLFDAPTATRPPKPDSAMLLAMSTDHRQGGAVPPTKAAPLPLPRTGAELVMQSRSCCSLCSETGHPCHYKWHADSQQLLCPPCNARKLGYLATPNRSGVYLEPTEFLAPPRKKNFHGLDIADIRLMNLGPHWIWATGFQLRGGDCRGSHSPLSEAHGGKAASRAEAISAASDQLRGYLEGCDNADARAIRAWLKTLDGGLL